ncbi:MAG: TlpA family protein disulfide reductase [Chitinophaga sp.]|uniref:TlpA family protein disulfide reductase n=1 Tax=Chitinophaga sp. TaxID=1869181 RepID=UPI0025BEE218|nr:TlpA disulfide reductase family protein [Chitinophaga sp.]MBV8252096.1 TlpA family protein disulfide reductase [Chitinophaga sp.]
MQSAITRILVGIFFFLIRVSPTAAQHKMDVTIRIPKDMDLGQIAVYYDNGYLMEKKYTPDSSVFQVKDTLLSRYGTITLKIQGLDTLPIFWVTDTPAVITLTSTAGEYQWQGQHATSPWGKPWQDMLAYIGPIYEEWHELARRSNHQPITDTFIQHFRSVHAKKQQLEMEYIRQHADEYYSFWFFRTNFHPSVELAPKYLDFFQQTFPKSFQDSPEAKEYVMQLTQFKNAGHPYPSPAFTTVTTNGDTLTLDRLKGKCVLFDFWATWCSGCIAGLPKIKEMTAGYSPDQLVVVGVNMDGKWDKFQNAVQKYNIGSWTHIFKSYGLANALGAVGAPTYILIDKKGNIIYNNLHLTSFSYDTIKEAIAKAVAE